jgi:hypothetical protein
LTLLEKIIALHRALAEERIPHAFGGALALAYWTRDPRGTSDIDLNVFVPAADSAPALAALPPGVARPEGTVEKIAAEGQIRLWWDETPVDLFFDYERVHADAARHSKEVPFAGTRIPILGPIELTVFKVIFDRTRHWADVEAMVAASTVDLDAVRGTLASMLEPGDPRFDRLTEAVRRAGSALS